MSATEKINVVVIGAGFGGIACAKKLAKNENVHVTLVDRRNHHLFQPLLYQVATANLAAPHIARSVRSIFDKTENVTVLFDHAQDFDLDGKKVLLEKGGALAYDYLVMATGAQTSFFGNDHWAPYVFQMKSLAGAFGIREQVLKNIELAENSDDPKEKELLSTIAIVGGGPTGVELSGAFADLIKAQMKDSYENFDPSTLRIVLIEGMPNLLGMFDEDQSNYTKAHLEKIGVEVLTNAMVSNIEPNKLTLKDGETIEASTIIWTAGVQATPLTQKLGAELTRGGLVIVNDQLQLPSHENVFVIGDTAAIAYGERFVPGVAPAAVQGGEYAADFILDKELGRKVPTAFEYNDKGKMAIIGKFAAIVDVKGLKFNGFVGWLVWLLIHLLFLIDVRNMVSITGAWYWAFIRNKPFARIFAAAADDK